MKWEEIETRYPAIAPPAIDWQHVGVRGKWDVQRAYVAALLTHFARSALGLDVGTFDLREARTVIETAYSERFMTFGHGCGLTPTDGDHWKGVCALLGAALGDPELVATCTGGKTLGTKVQRTKTYHHDLGGLARHLATAVRARLPPSHVAAAMAPLRDDFAAGKLVDPRVALVAAHTFLAQVAMLAPTELSAACRAWFDGMLPELPDRPVISAVADGDDARTRIRDEFAASLANSSALASHRDELATDHPHRFDFRVFQPDGPSEAATFLYLVGHELPSGWEARVDPHVARWLDGNVTVAAIAERRDALLAEHRPYVDPKTVRAYVTGKMAFDPALRALHLGDNATLAAYTGGGTLPAFKPGKFFKDDWRKLLRYFGAAAQTNAVTRPEVEPAWFDFLSRPRTVHVHWTNLLALQSILTVQIGRGDPRNVGSELRALITNSPAGGYPP